MSTLNVDKVDPSSGTALELGTSGDTITVPTGAGLTVTDEVKTNKVSPATGTAFALGDSGDTFTVPSGATIVNSGTATGFGITAASFRPNAQPIFYNGEMTVSQRGDATGITNANSGNYGPDRYKFNEDGTMTAVLSISRESLTSGNAFDDGFERALKYDVTTADASVAADIYARIEQRFEKGDLSLFKKGTSNAETYTLAFWVKATVTGTNVVELQDQVNTRHCCASYTISVTNTWEHKVLNFAADTSGALGSGTGLGMNVNFVLQAGTNYTSGTLATAWASSTDANRAVGQVNNFSSTSNNFHLTGIQLEVGTYTSATLPPFQHETFGANLMRCMRYYEKSYEVGTNPATATSTGIIRSGGNAAAVTSGRMGDGFTYTVPKRAAPTVTFYDPSGNAGVMARVYQGSGTGTSQNATLASGCSKSMEITSTGTYSGDVMNYHFTAVAEL